MIIHICLIRTAAAHMAMLELRTPPRNRGRGSATPYYVHDFGTRVICFAHIHHRGYYYETALYPIGIPLMDVASSCRLRT